MTNTHTHDHIHAHHLSEDERRLNIYIKAWGITFFIAFLELLGFLLSGSLALLADVSHVFTDTLVGLAPVSVEWLKKKTGWKAEHIERTGGVAASLILLFIGYHIIEEATETIGNGGGGEVSGGLIFLFSGIAAVANYAQHRILSRISPMHRHAAHAGFHFHILTDLVKNLLLPVLGIAIILTGNAALDAWAAFAIGGIVLLRATLLGLEGAFGIKIVQTLLHRFVHWIAR